MVIKKDPLSESALIITVHVDEGSEGLPRGSRKSVVSVAAVGKFPLIKSTTFDEIKRTIDDLWGQYSMPEVTDTSQISEDEQGKELARVEDDAIYEDVYNDEYF